MSLFQIWTTHNRPWSVREIIVFLIILSVCSFFIFRAVRRKRLKLQQGAAVLALILFLGVVFASTVFTRTPTVRRYERIPFWSWYEVIVKKSFKHNLAVPYGNFTARNSGQSAPAFYGVFDGSSHLSSHRNKPVDF